jgi:hypothetical protein
MGIAFSICPGRSGISEEHKTEFNYESEKQEHITPQRLKEDVHNTLKDQVDEETKNIKASLIQSNWKKRKEKQELLERIRVLDSNLNKLGEYIQVDAMKIKIDSRVKDVQFKLKQFKGSEDDLKVLDAKLTYRQPFKFKLDNSVYHGQWNNEGLREGYGLLITEDNIVMEGLWKEGKLYKGRIFREDGSHYQGDIKKYKANGQGKIVLSNGDVYEGRWNEFTQTGNGSRIFHDGYKYEGNFENDFFQEMGSFKWPDGSSYKGNFENSSFNGRGVFKSNSGEIFEGDFFNNFANGNGIYKFSGKNAGVVYAGSYKQGKKEGKGKLTFADDKYYEGEWINGFPHGQGLYKNGQNTYKGMWRYGFLVFANSGNNNPKKEEVSVPNLKESFKDRKQLIHLRDNIDGEIIGEEKNKKGKNYISNEAKEILKFVSRINKKNDNDNYVSTAI